MTGGVGWTERWYRALLFGYPREYRERHGDELVGTLLEAAPSRRLPSPRESASLLDAGLLARLRTGLDLVPAWADGLRLGLLLLALTQAGTLLGSLSGSQQRADLPVLLPAALLAALALLRGTMVAAAVLGLVPALVTTYQTLRLPAHGTDLLVGFFSSRTIAMSAGAGGWLSPGTAQFWLIAVGSLVLAVHRRTRGALPRRSWGWLAVLLVQAGFTAWSRTLLLPAPRPPAFPTPGGATLAAMLAPPLVATVCLLLLALRATVAIRDPRWMVAAGVYLVPVAVFAAAVVSVQPSAIVTLDYELPVVLLAAAGAVVLLRGAARRAVAEED
ncbi:hypothetical protein [Streptacidiphilus cavernicola]|uniref:Uncharacterized protein n=1 Tax=Streptacidiphilus cavernicola TaxID=3342716 RepID=A0ABV6W0N0_9ACTN